MHPDRTIDRPAPRRSRWWLPLLLITAAVLLYVSLRRPASAPVGPGHAGVGQQLPSLELEPLLEATAPLTLDDTRGKVTLINFWGPWCPPCLVEMPELLELEKKYRGRSDVAILLVSSSGGSGQEVDELREETRDTMRNFKANVPIYHDESNAAKQAVMESTSMPDFAFPTTIVIDGEGIIRGVWQGYQHDFVKEMGDVIEESLRRKSA